MRPTQLKVELFGGAFVAVEQSFDQVMLSTGILSHLNTKVRDCSVGLAWHTYQGQTKFVSKHESHILVMFEDHSLTQQSYIKF